MSDVLVLFYSRHGATQKMAEHIALGVEQVPNAQAKMRTVPSLHQTEANDSTSTYPFVTKTDLIECNALILGSPTRFGNISSNLQFFLESTLDVWLSGQLIGKPAGVFTSSDSQHGGQESTLLSLVLPLLHHGMVISGIPYNQAELLKTQTGGTPYGPSHVTQDQLHLSKSERELCIAFGQRMAQLGLRLQSSTT